MTDYKSSGVIDMSQVKLPENWQNLQKFFPVIECIEKIPCNPCSFSCPKGAITVNGDITNLPEIDFEKCNACSICAGKCPGLAIFLVNPNYSDDRAAVIIPYEFSPLPEKGDSVLLLDRNGTEKGVGRIEKIMVSQAYENTPLVTVSVPRGLEMEVRHFIPEGKNEK